MMRFFVIASALALVGCTSNAALVAALSKDQATACVTVTSVYGVVRVYRTNATNAKVSCNQDGLVVESR